MTTIAYDGKLIVGDSYFTNDKGESKELESVAKVRAFGRVLLGCSGDINNLNIISDEIYRLTMEWKNKGKLTPLPDIEFSKNIVDELTENFDLLLHQNKRCYRYKKEGLTLIKEDITDKFIVIGSGKDSSRFSDYITEDAFLAVMEGITLDPHSGGKLLYASTQRWDLNNLTTKTHNDVGELLEIYTTMSNTIGETVVADSKGLFDGELPEGKTITKAIEEGFFPTPKRCNQGMLPLHNALNKYEKNEPLTDEEYAWVCNMVFAKKQIEATKKFLKENPGTWS